MKPSTGEFDLSIKSISLRISVTDRCQLRCLYCTPTEEAPPPTGDVLTDEEIGRFVRIIHRDFGLAKIHITGGEPLLRPGLVDLVARLTREFPGELALTTNGQLLADRAPDLHRAGLQRVNISLASLRPETFRRMTGGGRVSTTLRGLRAAIDCGLTPVKINTVVLRSVNADEVVELARFGLQSGCPVRFLELMPIGPAINRFDDWFVASSETRARLAEVFELQPLPVRIGGSSRNYLARNGGLEGIIGFISSHTVPFCAGCRRLRLTSTGRLIGCLARSDGFDIRPLLHSDDESHARRLRAVVLQALTRKRHGRLFDTATTMVKIGG